MTGFKAPTEEQIRTATRRVLTPQLRRAFFEGLKNPLWVEPLAKEGVFASPPEPEQTDDGYLRDVYWPEMDYLARVAPDVPDAVVDVLLRLGDSTNAWVRRGTFEIGASIPAEQAARLKPIIKSWRSTGFGWRTDPTSLVSFAAKLIEGGDPKFGRWFANLLFRPSAPTPPTISLMLDEHWYEQGLPVVAKALGPDGLDLVLSWLETYERNSKHLTKDYDMSALSRDSIRQATVTIHDIERALIDAVRDLAIDAMGVDPVAAKDVLLKSKMNLSRKIALYSLAEALGRERVSDERQARLLAVAGELLFEDESRDDVCRIDYGELARAVARATGEPIHDLTRVIEAGPRIDAGQLRERIRGDSTDESEVDELVQEHHDRWRHLWLSAIGTDALPAQLRSDLAALDARYGVIDEPLAPTLRIQSWTGPNSPLNQDAMAAMSANELAAHLETWHAPADGWGPAPSHEGQGRELTELLTANPVAFRGVEDLVDRLRPTYVRAILRGWEGALKAGLELDWAYVSRFVSQVLSHGDASEFPTEGRRDWEDDLTYRPSKEAAVGLLEELAHKRDSPVVPAGEMEHFAELLITVPGIEDAWTEYLAQGEGSGMDPLTLSLNVQSTTRVRGLVHLVSHGKDTPWFHEARSALEVELERDDPWGACAAVLGEGLARLFNADDEWVVSKASTWFGTEVDQTASQQVALTTAMAVHYYHPTLYSLLSSSMLGAMQSTAPVVAGWKTDSDPLQRIGEWVIDAIIRGHKTIEDPVADKFFRDVPAKTRGEAIGHTGWSFMHAEAVDDEIRDRLAGLWDQRFSYVHSHPEDHEELSGFFWFVKSKKFTSEWWLPRLKAAIELHPGLSTERYMIGKEIAASADSDPRGAFDVMKLLLAGRDEAGLPTHDLTRNAVPVVLARAIASGDSVLAEDATAYMNHLGEQGYLSLRDDVRKVIEGQITQVDVDE